MRHVALLVSFVWALSVIAAVTIWSTVARGLSRDGSWTSIATLIVTVIAVVIAVMRRVGAPIGDLVGAAHRVAEGDFSARVPEHGPRSVRVVAAAFNNMAGRLAGQEQQRRELMADIAHELRTPLSVVQGRIEGLIDGVYPRETSQLEPLLEETRVLARLVEDLRTLANAESGVLALDREPTDIDMLMRDAASAVGGEAAQRGVNIRFEDAPTMPAVSIDPVRMRQVLVNVLANAVRHSGGEESQGWRPRSVVTVGAQITGGSLAIRVADTGPGISPEELPRIFDRFYKGPRSSGSGLGLTIARGLVRAHGGDIRAESHVGVGTTMTVTVPLEGKG
jgi:two-component system OmpR family sensor kinase/two-component system sensor histidine kinase BaeS